VRRYCTATDLLVLTTHPVNIILIMKTSGGKMSEKLIAFRLSEHLIQAIEARSKTTGRDKVDLVTEILARAFDTPQLNLELNDVD
jgi:hypothetical protein